MSITNEEKREFGKLRIRWNMSQLAKSGNVEDYPGYIITAALNDKELARLKELQEKFDGVTK